MILSIIIPNFNTKRLLHECLKSIYLQTKKIKFEVIVVDNASSDGSPQMIKKNFPQVKLIVNSKNLGYAKANNQGIKIAKGKYILFLNSDTIILDKAIEKCLKFMQKRKDIDILGCQLLNEDKSLQPSGGFFPQLRQIFYMMVFIDDLPFINRLLKPYQQRRIDFYQKVRQLDWATGAFLLVKREVINKIGGFDPTFFMYSEEVDFCFRAKKAGFNIWFYPKAKVIHLKGKSSACGFEKAVLGEYQGLKKFYKKHKPGWEMPILIVLLKIGAMLRVIIFGILKGDKNKKKIYEKAYKLV